MVVLKTNIDLYQMLTNYKLVKVRLNKITVDRRIKSLIAVFCDTINGYYHTHYDHEKLSNIVVFNDSKKLYLAYGWHRYETAKKDGKEEVECEIIFGTLREAIQYTLSRANKIKPKLQCNTEHKRSLVMWCMDDPEWGQMSERWIARMCSVSPALVSKVYQEKIEEMCSGVAEEESV